VGAHDALDMASKKRVVSKGRTSALRQTGDRELLSLSVNPPSNKLSYDLQQQLEKPLVTATSTPLNTIVLKCRLWAKESDFLSRYLLTKRSIYNFGFNIVPASLDGKKPKTEDKEKLLAWQEEEAAFKFDPIEDPQTKEPIEPEVLATNDELVRKFADDSWDEWNLLDNCTAMWLEDQGFANIIPVERCDYSDTLGVPLLRFTHGLSTLDIAKLPKDQQDRFRTHTSVMLNTKFKEHFKVLKRARLGDGYGLPRLYQIFRLLGEVESKQIGMNAMAFMMRTVVRLHRLGHEIKNGDRAGKPTHFWKQEVHDATIKAWKDAVGVQERTVNFDHFVEYPWPDLKLFDELAFKGSDKRLMEWGGPIMLMLAAKGVMPYLSPMLRAQAADDRDKMGAFLAMVINKAFLPPVPVEVTWSNTVFNESRLAAELLKFGSQQGFLSATTAKEEAGFDPVAEEDLKVQEADDPDADKKFKPMWDSSHGIAPALGETITPPGGAKGANPGSRSGNRPGTQHAS
jgi:hypothetical protein